MNSPINTTVVRGIIQHDNKILLCKSLNKANYFLIGGHVKIGEGHIDALKREVHEEVGYGIKNIKKVNEFINIYSTNFSIIHERNIVYTFDFVENAYLPIYSLENHIEFYWINKNNLSKITILPNKISTAINESIH